MSVDEASLWPDPEPVDEIGDLPPSSEAVFAQEALTDAPTVDGYFGADIGERHADDPAYDDGEHGEVDPAG